MEIAFYQGEFIPINKRVVPIQERAHQFGDGVYEVIRVYNGVPFYMEAHLDRLERSAAAIRIALPYSRPHMQSILLDGLKKSGLTEADIYVQVTRGIAARQHTFPDVKSVLSMTIRKSQQVKTILKERGAKVLLREDERWKNCYIKSLNLLPNVLAKQAAVEAGYDEALLVRDGNVMEGSSSNFFIVKDGLLLTPPATNYILDGITRQLVLKLARDQQLPLKEAPITERDLMEADEVFLTSTTMEVLPVTVVNTKEYPFQEDGICERLRDSFEQLYRKR